MALHFHQPRVHLLVRVVLEEGIVATGMPRVEGMEANGVQPFVRERARGMVLEYLIHVLVVPPCHQQLVQAAAFFVDAQLRPKFN